MPQARLLLEPSPTIRLGDLRRGRLRDRTSLRRRYFSHKEGVGFVPYPFCLKSLSIWSLERGWSRTSDKTARPF